MPINIAIDGPAGAGKSTAAKAIAKEFNFIYIDTGALYRAVALYALSKGVGDVKSEKDVLPLLKRLKLDLKHVDNVQKVFINGEDVSDLIRTPELSMAASDISSIPGVRKYLLDLQRNIAKENNVVMDGRDIGTVVLPDADVKIYLIASPEERADRRVKEHIKKGLNVDFKETLNEMKIRDNNDANRTIAPLKQAADSILFDNSNMTMEQSVENLILIIKERLKDVL